MNIPSILRAGDTTEWTESISDYPATDGWTLRFSLRAKDKSLIDITATASGADYAVTVTHSASKGWKAGDYYYQAFVYKETDGLTTDRHTIQRGRIEILPNLADASSQDDFRSVAQINLDMLDAAISGNTSPDVMSYSIAGRSLSRFSKAELREEREYWKGEVESELTKEIGEKGTGDPRHIKAHLVRI